MNRNTEQELVPLKQPSPWPVPGEPQVSAMELYWRSVPLVGWCVAGIIGQRRWWKYYHRTLRPIEEQLLYQLRHRPTLQVLEHPTNAEKVLEILSTAIAEEKAIAAPVLHPDDVMELLCWSAYDDMTAFRFANRLAEYCGYNIPESDVARFWTEHWKVRNVCEYCISKMDTNRE